MLSIRTPTVRTRGRRKLGPTKASLSGVAIRVVRRILLRCFPYAFV